MRQTMTALACLPLSIFLSSCASRPVTLPPQIIQVPTYAPLPAACFRLRPIYAPDGASVLEVIEEQQRVLLEYREQIKACAATTRQD